MHRSKWPFQNNLWRARTGEAREGGWGAVDRSHMLQRGSLIRVWVAIHPRRTARKARSLWVWVGSHPRRTETLWFIYRYVCKHKETNLVGIWNTALLTNSQSHEIRRNVSFKLRELQHVCGLFSIHGVGENNKKKKKRKTGSATPHTIGRVRRASVNNH